GTANEYGPVPPPPVSVRAYAAPAPAPGSDAGESVTTGQLTVNEALVRLSAPLAATSCMAPGPLTTRLANVETPSESPTTAPLPVSAPEPTSDSETERPGTGLPNASAARTRTAGVIAAPAATFVGCWTNDSAEAAAGDTVNGTLVSAASAPLAAVSCLPPLRSTRR